MLKNKKILIISTHPDDEAICFGGLIMLAKKEKAKVHVVYMAVGQSRQFLTKQTTEYKRIPEMKAASKYGNFTYTLVFTGQAFMRLDSIPQKELIEKIEDESEKFKPDIVGIPFRSSFDQDHRATALACITAFRPLPNTLRHQPSIIFEAEEPYSWSTDENFKPNLYLDISDVFEEKIELLKLHNSQVRSDPFPRSPENLRRIAGIRGCEISTTYAESYNLLRGQLL
ncbi:MAG: PIG-L deacetylase family protein [Candidatus Levyibacteriota bacterium]